DSEGCIEIQNHDIATLEDEIKLRDTPILVYEKINYLTKDELKNEAQDITAFVENWRKAWSSKNIPAYMAFYDREFFNSDGLSHQGWMERKTRVAAGYKTISIEIKDLRVYRHRDTVIVTFTQDYNGDSRFRSLGYKRLYLKGQMGDWRIVAEEYGPLPGPPPAKWLTAAQKEAAITTPPLAVAQLSEPVAEASAGAILPSSTTLVAENTAPQNQSQAQAAADESARAAIEQRTNQQNTQSSEVTVLASLSSTDDPRPVTRDTPSAGSMVSSGSIPAAGSGPRQATLVPASSKSVSMAAGGSLAPSSQAEPSHPAPLASETNLAASPKSSPETSIAASPETSTESTLVASSEITESQSLPGQDEMASSFETTEPSGDLSPSATAAEALENLPSQAETMAASEPDQSSTLVASLGGDLALEQVPDETEAFEPLSALTAEAAQSLLEEWIEAWSAKDENSYFSFYASDFLFKDLNLHLNSFKRYRSRRFKEAGQIYVEASDVQIKVSGENATITFEQRYQSERYADLGIKTLKLAARDGQWRIVSEAFQARP
ncbi:MAG: nuclear transport factor 2 family protein, partial [Deltaproteobacteria bacterium]|nr:nuclear transport factor 2 family protein [Deltaproteobacteria bacterium]